MEASPLIETDGKNVIYSFGDAGNAHYVIGKELMKSQYFIHRVSNDLSTVETNSAKWDLSISKSPLSTWSNAGRLFYLGFESKNSMSASTITYSVVEVDASNLTPQGEPLKLPLKPAQELVYGKTGVVDRGRLIMAESPNGEYIAVSVSGPEHSKENAQFQIASLNKNTLEGSATELNPGMEAELFNRNALAVDNSGFVYLLATLKTEPQTLKEYRLYKFDPTGGLVSDVSIPTGRLIYCTTHLFIDSKGSLLLTGLTSTTSTDKFDGISYMRFSADNLEQESSQAHSLPSEFESKTKAIKNGSFDYFRNSQAVVTPNDDVVISTEYVKRYSDTGTEYGDLLAFRMNSVGEISATGILKKEQQNSQRYTDYSSYRLVNLGEEVYIFYNDLEKNEMVPAEEEGTKTRTTGYYPLFAAQLTQSGFKKELLYSSNKEKLRTNIQTIYKQKNSGIFIYEDGLKGSRIRKLNF
jgi:hypothetical protein